MKFVRMTVVVLLIAAIGLYGVSWIKEKAMQDPTEPIIESDREVLEIPCAYTPEQLVEGLTAYDEEDGDLTSHILVGSMSRFLSAGECNLTYVVFDSANQAASVTRKVRFTDYASPQFTLTEPLVFVEGEGSYKEAMSRIGATDKLDGNLTEWITQGESDVSYSHPGAYTMPVEVSNSFGDTTTLDLPVHVLGEDEQQLEIALTQGVVYWKQGQAFDAMNYVEELSDVQGNRLSRGLVQANAAVNVNVPGVYEVHYTAQDSNGQRGQTWLTVVVRE